MSGVPVTECGAVAVQLEFYQYYSRATTNTIVVLLGGQQEPSSQVFKSNSNCCSCNCWHRARERVDRKVSQQAHGA